MTSYVLEGPKWSSSVVTWSFATSTLAGDGSVPFSNAITSAAYQALVQQAFARWQSVSGLTFQQVSDSASTDIRVGFGAFGTSSSEIGETSYASTKGDVAGSNFEPDVVVRVEDPAQDPVKVSGSQYVYTGTSTAMYQVILHEIGHALGMDHDTDVHSVMYPTATPSNRDLDATDIAGIQALYGPPPASAATVPAQTASTPTAVALTTITLHGTHDQYLITANPDGSMYIADSVSGRDGTQTIAHAGDIVFSDGTGRFDADGSAERVARLYQAGLGRTADSGGLDYWTAQAEGGAGFNAIANTFVASPEFQAQLPSGSNGDFVNLLYEQVLGHAADQGGFAYWTGELGAGVQRGAMLLSFADSDESRADAAVNAGDNDDGEAYRVYRAALNRVPSMAEMDYWSDALRGGGTTVQMAQSFLSSPEFQANYGGLNGAGFVNALYQNVLGRAPDSGGAAYWTGVLSKGASQAQVLLGLSDSLENRANTAPATHANWIYLG